MKVIYGLTHFKLQDKKPVIALGIFDGLHRGHCRIISRLTKEAKKLHTKSILVTFFPHPQKENSIYSLTHRLKLIEQFKVDICLVLQFTPAFRKITAEEFINRILMNKINPAIVIIGRNFTFGKAARGNRRLLKKYSDKKIFKLIVMDVLNYKGKPISSTWIRNLIKKGDFLEAQKLLGRPVTILGRVRKGHSLGAKLGYPTANVNPEHEVLPPFGVYAVKIKLANNVYPGICYIGNKPTIMNLKERFRKSKLDFFNLPTNTNIEAHIFNFKGNIYGRRIQIEFIQKLRPQKRFGCIDELSLQIKKDIQSCLSKMRRG